MMSHLPQDENKLRQLMGRALVVVFSAVKQGGPVDQVEKMIDQQCGKDAELRTMAYSVLASVSASTQTEVAE